MNKVIRSNSTDCYKNLALENFLLDSYDEGVVFYLWVNARTVVVGRNQNAASEVNINAAEKYGVKIARRMTGGGAVYHHVGNLNFTFIAGKEYNLDKQLKLIVATLKKFGIDACVSGRNDLTVEGRKFSGNAFLSRKDVSLHHGTLLIDEDETVMSEVLTPSALKLKSRGVDSVRARVTNLKNYNSILSPTVLADALISEFGKEYGEYEEIKVSEREIMEYYNKFSSHEWIYGLSPAATFGAEMRTEYGLVTVHFSVVNERLKGVTVFTDSLSVLLAERIKSATEGVLYRELEIQDALESNGLNGELKKLFMNFQESFAI